MQVSRSDTTRKSLQDKDNTAHVTSRYMAPAQWGQSAIAIGIAIGIAVGIAVGVAVIVLPLQHHIIAGVDPPLVYMTAIGSAPVTSKGLAGRSLGLADGCAGEMESGLATCHNT